MKALSLSPMDATTTLQELRRVDWRPFETSYRGELVICAAKNPWVAGSIHSHALCIVDLTHVHPFTIDMLDAARMYKVPDYQGFGWIFDEPYFIEPFEVPEAEDEGLFDVDDSKIKLMDPACPFTEFADRWYKPLMKWSDPDTSEEQVRAEWDSWMGFLRMQDEERGV